MGSRLSASEAKVALRLYSPASESEGGGGLSADMTLPEFFEAWYVPVRLVATGANEKSIHLLRISLDWWRELTGDPPLRLIDDYTIAQFSAGLRKSTYRRGKLGPVKPLTTTTINNHLRHVRRILARAGQKSPACPQAAGLIDPPYVPQKPNRAQPRNCFTITQWQSLFLASRKWAKPQSALMPAPLFWQAFFALLLYTGFRVGTILRLEWRHVVCQEGIWFIDVPSELVGKTGKATKRIIHASLWDSLQLVRQPDLPRLIPFRVHEDTGSASLEAAELHEWEL